MRRISYCSFWLVLAVAATGLAYGQEGSPGSDPKSTAGEPASAKEAPAQREQTPVKGLTGVTTESGLKYWDIKVGDGKRAAPGATVTFHYVTWFPDGKYFDSSYEKGEPITKPLERLVTGLGEGISSMRIGGKRRLEIPSELAYGEKGSKRVPPNTALIYEVELLGFEALPEPTSVEGLKPVITASGLKYYDLKVGTGDKPFPHGKVKAHYSIWIVGDKLLRTTLSQPEPVPVSLDGVCDGWAEGVGSMRVGGKRQLHVPPRLGLGEKGGGGVPPNASLIFEIELFDILNPPHLAAIEGVTPLESESGLKYWDIRKGAGSSPRGTTSTITLSYIGWLSDGTKFDDSESRGGSVTVRFDKLVRGLQEGIGAMKEGGKRWIQVPPELGFGDKGHSGTNVGPGETLIFEVELIKAGPPRHLAAIEGVQPMPTDSGLLYHDIRVGGGETPTMTSTVTIEYRGWHADGRMFLSTEVDGEPLVIGLSQVIPGLREGIASMKVGGIRWLEVPPELGFGEAGHPPNNVGPNETLIFEVELINVE